MGAAIGTAGPITAKARRPRYSASWPPLSRRSGGYELAVAAVARAKDWSCSVASTSVMPLFYGTPGSRSRSATLNAAEAGIACLGRDV